jgi:GNAT superfamily N-acetyltransferase
MGTGRDIVVGELTSESPHLATVARWLSEAWGISQGYDLSETLAWCHDLAEADDQTIIAATRASRLVGTVLVVDCDLDGYAHLRPWVSSLYVPPAERRRAIGESLLGAACDWARAEAYSTLYLYARKGRLTAYYGRLGWRRLRDVALDGQEFQIMGKSLSEIGRDP